MCTRLRTSELSDAHWVDKDTEGSGLAQSHLVNECPSQNGQPILVTPRSFLLNPALPLEPSTFLRLPVAPSPGIAAGYRDEIKTVRIWRMFYSGALPLSSIQD